MPKDTTINYDVYKHTHAGILHEQIILGDRSCFLSIVGGKVIISDMIDLPSQNSRLYPRDRFKISSRIRQFKFTDESEIYRFIEKAKSLTIDDLYDQCKIFWHKLVVAGKDETLLLCADTILSFFQDRFTQTHYIMVIGLTGTGKNAIFTTLKYLGYRVLVSTNMRSAHIIDLLGSTEPCQITLIEDEFYDIYKDREKLNIYITGYESDGFDSRTVDGGKPTRRLVEYNTFCFKLFGAEYLPKASQRRGLDDRSFQINSRKGIPQYYVKNLNLRKLPKEYKALLDKIDEFHKLMLLYRMIHIDDDIDIANTNIDTRALELTGPLINLFSADSLSPTKRSRPEILNTLSVFLRKKGKLDQITLEYIIYEVLKEQYNATQQDPIIVPHNVLRNEVMKKCDATKRPNEEAFYSTMIGRVTFKRVYEQCKNVFGGEPTTYGTGDNKTKAHSFSRENIERLESQYKITEKIEIVNNDSSLVESTHINSVVDAGTLGRKQTPQICTNNDTDNNNNNNNSTKGDFLGVPSNEVIINNNNNIGLLDSVSSQLDPKSANNAATQSYITEYRDLISVPTSQSKSSIQETLGTYVAWDLEWNAHNEITAASFYDNNDQNCVYLREDFNYSERALLEAIISKLSEYSTSIGWYTTGREGLRDGKNSDLMHLHERSIENGLDSIVNFWPNGQPIGIVGQTHIDLCVVFDNKMIKDTVYKISYFNRSLDHTGKILTGEGKYDNKSGDSFNYLPAEEKRKYALQDSKLVMKISRHDNYKALDLMLAISQLCDLPFDYVCMTSLAKWWEKIYKRMIENMECGLPTKDFESFKGTKPKGGKVFEPAHGFYNTPTIVIDAKSLYPSVAIIYNISFDTLNCECCADNPECKITEPLVLQDCRFEKEYWICHEVDGSLKQKLITFREERFRQQELGNESAQSVLKILINGAYGLFAYKYFKFRDPRVAELITAYGRFTLLKMKDLAREMGLSALYGDTDSLFISVGDNADATEIVEKFKQRVLEQLQVEVELKRIYDKFFLSKGKKHYVGIGSGLKEPDVVGMEGKKSNTPKFIRRVFKTIVNKIFKSEKITESLISEVTSLLRAAMAKLDNWSEIKPDELLHCQKLGKNPEDYKGENHQMRKRGQALGLSKGDVVEVYESINDQGWSKDPVDLNVQWYKQTLWNVVGELLQSIGFPVIELANEFGVKLSKKKDGHSAKPSSGVADNDNCLSANLQKVI